MGRFWEELKLSNQARVVGRKLRMAFKEAGYPNIKIDIVRLPGERTLNVNLDGYEMTDQARLTLLEKIGEPLGTSQIQIMMSAASLNAAEATEFALRG